MGKTLQIHTNPPLFNGYVSHHSGVGGYSFSQDIQRSFSLSGDGPLGLGHCPKGRYRCCFFLRLNDMVYGYLMILSTDMSWYYLWIFLDIIYGHLIISSMDISQRWWFCRMKSSWVIERMHRSYHQISRDSIAKFSVDPRLIHRWKPYESGSAKWVIHILYHLVI